ncbi:hypothetical protein TRFO_19286 [Tritrichomonas foetus]|uniref:ubiquitinyl hydrolase 1 n=1 Tax=Tritrichomonas foetus TaxID=1144522 RepID=A0A1J4KJM9_9EUKA|nr:hypothetical protein TRFO_19286 [Tritrichomonas foetus]|eukprot:OHT11306.1 hypothetical protein TRFO_19286 [Tritrichomonas foetus]
MNRGGANHIDPSPAIRKELRGKIKSLCDIKPEARTKKVVLVDKKWHDKLIRWLSDSHEEQPGQIPFKSLYSAGKIKSEMKLGVDYEIVEGNVWNKLSQVFGPANSPQKIEGSLTTNPMNGEPIVLLNPISFKIFTPRTGGSVGMTPISQDCDPNWTIADLKQQISRISNYDPSTFYLVQHFGTAKMQDAMTLKDAMKRYKADLDIKMDNPKLLPPIQNARPPSVPKSKIPSRIGNMNKIIKKAQEPSIIEPKTGNKGMSRKNSLLNDKNLHALPSNKENITHSPRNLSSRSRRSNESESSISSSNKISRVGSKNNSNSSSNRNIDNSIGYSRLAPGARQKSVSTRPRMNRNNSNNSSSNNYNEIDTFNSSGKLNNSGRLNDSGRLNNLSKYDDSGKFDSDLSSSGHLTGSFPGSGNSTGNISNSIMRTTSEPIKSQPIDYLSCTTKFPKPVGLNNLGNTCFFNAAVQCLTRVQPLTDFILSSKFESAINPRNPKSSKGKIACAYREYLELMCRSGSGARDPSNLRKAIVSKFKRFANFSQHDSQELLGSLLDGLHEDLNQSAAAKGNDPPIEIPKEPDSWDVHISRNSSPIVDLFHGKLYSSISCPECGRVESVHDPFMFLELEIPRKFSAVKLNDCLKSFSQCDVLDADNKWKCEGCKNMVCATKEMGIDQCAEILIIHLKRFSGEGYFASKIDTNVDYPDTLDTNVFTRKKSGVYRLIGAVFHSGGLGGGHYTAAAIDPSSGKWYNFNDSMASPIDSTSAHSGRAYILFYQRK